MKGIHVQDIADYTNARREVDQGEMEAFLLGSAGAASPTVLTALAQGQSRGIKKPVG